MVIATETVRRPLGGWESTLCTSVAIGSATSFGQVSNRRAATREARSASPMKPAMAATKIRNGNTAISADSATWLAIAQPSSSLRWPSASPRTARACRKKDMTLAARSPKIGQARVSWRERKC